MFVHERPRFDEVTAGCRCGKAGHKLLSGVVTAAATGTPLYNGEGFKPTWAVRSLMHNLGLVDTTEWKEAGWERGMWSVALTPAGRFHHAYVIGKPGTHVDGCGGIINVDETCEGCHAEIAMTTGEAARRLWAMPPSAARDDKGGEVWASSFACVTHGRCRASMVSTAKTCTICREGLLRLGTTVLQEVPPEPDPAVPLDLEAVCDAFALGGDWRPIATVPAEGSIVLCDDRGREYPYRRRANVNDFIESDWVGWKPGAPD